MARAHTSLLFTHVHWWHIQARTSDPCRAFTAAIWRFSLIIVILEAVNGENSSEWNLKFVRKA